MERGRSTRKPGPGGSTVRPVPKRQGQIAAPRDYVVSGEWPHARLDTDQPGVAEAAVAQALAARLAAAVGKRSMREVARAAGVAHTTVTKVAAGARWPELVTIARLERALDVDLWPGRGP